MIDLDAISYDMHPKLKSYTGITQLIEADQDILEGKLVYPRMTWNWIVSYTSQSLHSMVAKRNIVVSDDPNFTDDIEYEYILTPQVTLSINAFGDDVSQYIRKAREWFQIPKLADRLFEGHNAVVRNIADSDNRKTFLETDYEDRESFDVIIVIEDRITVRESTIETVEIKFNGNIQEFDI